MSNNSRKHKVSELTPTNAENIVNAVNRLIELGDYNKDNADFPVFQTVEHGIKCMQRRNQTFSVLVPFDAAVVFDGDWDSEDYEDPALSVSFHWADGEGFDADALSSLSVDFFSVIYNIFGGKSFAHVCLAGGVSLTD